MSLTFIPALLPATRRPVHLRSGHFLKTNHGMQERGSSTPGPRWRSLARTTRILDETSKERLEYTKSAESASGEAQNLVASGRLDPADAPILSTWTARRASLFARVLTNRSRHITFVLDGVHGAHNLAAIARTSDAWGVQDVHFVTPQPSIGEDSNESKTTWVDSHVPVLQRFDSEYSVRSVSKNAHKWLTIREHTTSTDAIRHLRNAGYKLYTSSLSPTAKSIESIDVSQKCAFVFGNETHGVTDEMQNAADGFFTIPMVGFVESMNVSVAVGTTACLTIPRGRATLPPDVFYLTPAECSQLAHGWLFERPRPKPSPRPQKVPTRGDVTRLGTQVERRVMDNGVSTNPDLSQQCFSGLRLWRTIFCLHGETGGLILSYFQRRKFGALGDRKWDVRCNSITYFVAGVQALTCAAILTPYSAECKGDRLTLMRALRTVCEGVHAMYEPHFDPYGYPKAPPNAPEAEGPVRQLSNRLADIVFPAATDYAKEALELESSDVQSILDTFNIQDICSCISQTFRLPSTIEHSFTAEVIASLPRVSELQSLLSTRGGYDKILQRVSQDAILTEVSSFPKTADRKRMLFLQILLRMSNAAFLSSEMHQAVWDNAADLRTSRVRSLQFNFLEALSCDALSEMQLLGADEDISLLRVALEWYRLIWILKQS